MRISAVGVVFLSLVQTLTGIIQGLGKQQVPVFNLAAGALVKVILMLTLMRNPDINIDGAAIATVACYAVAGVLDLLYLTRLARLRIRIWELFGKPLVASLLMGGVTYLAEAALSNMLGTTSLSTLLSVGVGVVVYAALVLLLRMFSPDDLRRIPGGARLNRLLYGGRGGAGKAD